MASKAKLGVLARLGRWANTLGVPGFVRDSEYRSKDLCTTVRVKRGQFFTVITVNGTDVYFDRFSGEIDGVGFSPGLSSASKNMVPNETRTSLS